jgi:alpha-tubulin suppressor-like RCC1 family protein
MLTLFKVVFLLLIVGPSFAGWAAGFTKCGLETDASIIQPYVEPTVRVWADVNIFICNPLWDELWIEIYVNGTYFTATDTVKCGVVTTIPFPLFTKRSTTTIDALCRSNYPAKKEASPLQITSANFGASLTSPINCGNFSAGSSLPYRMDLQLYTGAGSSPPSLPDCLVYIGYAFDTASWTIVDVSNQYTAYRTFTVSGLTRGNHTLGSYINIDCTSTLTSNFMYYPTNQTVYILDSPLNQTMFISAPYENQTFAYNVGIPLELIYDGIGQCNVRATCYLDGALFINSEQCGTTCQLATGVLKFGYHTAICYISDDSYAPFANDTVTFYVGDNSIGLCVIGWGHSEVYEYGQEYIPDNLYNIRSIASGRYHSVALTTNGRIIGWGDNTYGQSFTPVGILNALQISASELHTAVLLDDATVVGWGWLKTLNASITGYTNIAKVVAGSYHTLMLHSNKSVLCVGENYYGECGTPPAITNGNTLDIAAGEYFSVAILLNGTIIGWGNSSDSRLAVPTGLPPATDISASGSHTLARLSNGSAICWGSNTYGECDFDGGFVNEGVTLIATGPYNSAVVTSDGWIWVVGLNSTGILNVPWLDDVTQVAIGAYHMLSMSSSIYGCHLGGYIVQWNQWSSLYDIPRRSLPDVLKISNSDETGLAILKEDLTVVEYGTVTYGSPPKQRPSNLTNVIQIDGVDGLILVEFLNGTMTGWGYNDYGQADVPSNVTNVFGFAAGGTYGIAITELGTLTLWGRTDYFYDNISYPTNRMLPTNLNNVISVCAGLNFVGVLLGNGTVLTYGRVYPPSTPTLDPPTNLGIVLDIVCDHYTMGALLANGSVIIWGSSSTLSLSANNIVKFDMNRDLLTIDTDAKVTSHWNYAPPLWLENVFDVSAGYYVGDMALTLDQPPAYATFTITRPYPGEVFTTYWDIPIEGYITIDFTYSVLQFTCTFSNLITAISAPCNDTNCSYVMPSTPYGLNTIICYGIADGYTQASDTSFFYVYPQYPCVMAFGTGNNLLIPQNVYNVTDAINGPHTSYFLNNDTFVGSISQVDVRIACERKIDPVYQLIQHINGTIIGIPNTVNVYTSAALIPSALQNANITSLSCGWFHALAVINDSAIVAWMNNNPLQNFSQTVVPPNLGPIRKVIANYLSSFALLMNGSVVVWGRNDSGILNVPPGLNDVVDISTYACFAGTNKIFALALCQNGSVFGWGDNSYGQTNITNGIIYRKISAGCVLSILLDENGGLHTFGRYADTLSGPAYFPIENATKVTDVYASEYTTVLLTESCGLYEYFTPSFNSCVSELCALTFVGYCDDALCPNYCQYMESLFLGEGALSILFDNPATSSINSTCTENHVCKFTLTADPAISLEGLDYVMRRIFQAGISTALFNMELYVEIMESNATHANVLDVTVVAVQNTTNNTAICGGACTALINNSTIWDYGRCAVEIVNASARLDVISPLSESVYYLSETVPFQANVIISNMTGQNVTISCSLNNTIVLFTDQACALYFGWFALCLSSFNASDIGHFELACTATVILENEDILMPEGSTMFTILSTTTTPPTTETPTVTETITVTETLTVTETPTVTSTETVTPTETETPTVTGIPTETVTSTEMVTSTETVTTFPPYTVSPTNDTCSNYTVWIRQECEHRCIVDNFFVYTCTDRCIIDNFNVSEQVCGLNRTFDEQCAQNCTSFFENCEACCISNCTIFLPEYNVRHSDIALVVAGLMAFLVFVTSIFFAIFYSCPTVDIVKYVKRIHRMRFD